MYTISIENITLLFYSNSLVIRQDSDFIDIHTICFVNGTLEGILNPKRVNSGFFKVIYY